MSVSTPIATVWQTSVLKGANRRHCFLSFCSLVARVRGILFWRDFGSADWVEGLMSTHLGLRQFFGSCVCCKGGPPVPSSVNRRTALSGMAAVGLAASAPIIGRVSPALAQNPPVSKLSLIDVHHHFVPPVYLAENRDRVSPAALKWEPQKALDAMDAQNVATAVLSLPLPGVWFGDAQAARRMSRL